MGCTDARPRHRVAIVLLCSLLAGGFAQTCTFPTPTLDVECFGLSPALGVSSQADCQNACCALDAAGCSTWQWCPTGAPCDQVTQCWVGHPLGMASFPDFCVSMPNTLNKTTTGWVGGYRSTPPTVGTDVMIVPLDPTTGLPSPYALRHCNYEVSADPGHGVGTRLNADFVWRVSSGLDENPASLTFSPVSKPGQSLGLCKTGSPGMRVCGENPGSNVLGGDLSYLATQGVENADFYSLLTQSNDATYTGQYVTLSSVYSGSCASNSPVGSIVPTGPSSGTTPNGGQIVTQTFTFVPVVLPQFCVWAEEHHDPFNSRFSSWDGPGESSTVCHEQLIRDAPASGTRFFSSGIASANDGWWFGGDSTDTFYMLEDLLVARQNEESWQSWSINLTAYLGLGVNGMPPPATPYGIVGAPAAMFPADFAYDEHDSTKNFVFVASANGWVVSINPLYCFNAAVPIAPKLTPTKEGGGSNTNLLRGGVRRRVLPPMDAPQDDAPTQLPSASVSLGPGGSQWSIYSDINAVYSDSRRVLYGTTSTFGACQEACWADFVAKGSLGDPDACVTWTWHDQAQGQFAYQCFFLFTSGFVAHPQSGHFSGSLTTSTPGPGCLAWSQQINPSTNFPSYSSVKLLTTRLPGSASNTLLVSETHPTLNTGGVLHGLDPFTGQEQWRYGDGTWGIKGVLPAQLPVGNASVLLVPYGTRLVAVDMGNCPPPPALCPEIGSYDTAADFGPGGDELASSIVLTYSANACFFHSAGGYTWLLNVDYRPTSQPPTVTFSMSWACKYDVLGGCTPPPSPPSFSPPYQTHAQAPAPGGFYQPTTALEAQQLHSAIASAHLTLHGPEAGLAATELERSSPLALTSRLALELPRSTLYALVTPSSYARLHPSGRRTAPEDGPRDFGGTLPLATPAFLDSRNLLAVVDYPMDGSDSSLLVLYASYGTVINTTDPITGAAKPFRVSLLTLPDSTTYPMGRTRSSPAWDRTSHLYVGADLDVGMGAAFLPTVFSVDAGAVVRWAAALDGASADATVGSASVVVTLGPRKDSRLYIAAEDGVHAVQEPAASAGGAVCPHEGLLDCSGHGDCDCASGMCKCWGCWGGADCGVPSEGVCTASGGTCTTDGHCACGDACHSGPDCSTLTQCGNGGTCNPLDGSCSCPGVCLTLNHFGKCGLSNSSLCANGGLCDGAAGPGLCSCVGPAACFKGPDCSVPIVCGAHSVCVPGGPGGCTCIGGWSGPSCTIPPSSSATVAPPPLPPGGGGGSGASSGAPKTSPGAVAVGVLVPLLLLGAGAAGLVVAVRNGYHLPWAAADSLVQRWVGRVGSSAYTPLKPAMGGLAAAKGGAGGAGAEVAAGRLAASVSGSRTTSGTAGVGGAGSERMSLLHAVRTTATPAKGNGSSSTYSSM